MEEDIKIITVADSFVSLFDRSINDIYDQLISIETDNYIDYIDLIKSLIETKQLLAPVDLPELLVRQIIAISIINTNLNIYAIPQVYSDNKRKNTSKAISWVGGDNNNTGNIIFNKNILIYHNNNNYNILLPNTDIAISKIIINPICSIPKVPTTKKKEKILKEYSDTEKDLCFNDSYKTILSHSSNISGINYSIDLHIVDISNNIDLKYIYIYFLNHYKFYSSLDGVNIVNQLLNSSLNTTNIQHYKHVEMQPKQISYDNIKIFDKTITYFNNNELATYTLIDLLGMWSIYSLITVDFKLAKDLLSDHIHNQNQQDLFRKEANKIILLRNKLNDYLRIIKNKISQKKFVQLNKELNNQSINEPDKLLSLLDDADKKIVLLEIEKEIKYKEAILSNKCEHVKICKRLKFQISDYEIKKILEELEPYMKVSDDKIICNNCGFDIICPHLLTFYKSFQDNQNILRGKLEKYMVRTSGGIYCRLCAEKIYLDLDAEEIDEGIVGDINIELNKQIWSETLILLKYFKFAKLVHIPTIIFNCRENIYKFVYEIDKKLTRSKNQTEEIIKAKRSLHISIYILAYFIYAIEHKIINEMTLKQNKQTLVDMIKHSISIVLISKNIALREIPNMSADIIKTYLVDAYKSIKNEMQFTKSIKIKAEIFNDSMIFDDVYQYIFKMNRLNEILEHNKVVDFIDHMTSYNKIIKPPPDKVPEDYEPYIQAVIPSLSKINSSKFLSCVFSYKSFIDIVPIIDGLVKESFILLTKRINLMLHTKPPEITTLIKKEEFATTQHEDHIKYNSAYLTIQKKEKELFKYKNLYNSHTYNNFKIVSTRQWKNMNTSLGRIFDENGKQHVWNIIIDKEGNEHPKKTFNKVNEIADIKCSICKIKQSNVDKLDENKIRAALITNNNITNFYKYYELRCPEDGVHDYIENKCKKCDMKLEFFKKIYEVSSDMLEIYKKYENKYNSLKSPPKLLQLEYHKSKVGEVNQYDIEIDIKIINTFCTKMSINPKLILALGASENQAEDDIISGKYIPHLPKDKNNTQAYNINAYIKVVICDYNLLKNYMYINKPPKHITKIINDSRIPKNKYQSVANNLPDIYDDYNNKFEYVLKHFKPLNIINFCLQTLCLMLLKIIDNDVSETSILRKLFVDYITSKIMRGEKLLTKYDAFNWSALYSQESSTQEFDANYVVEDNDEEIEDPIAVNEFDIEDDNDEQTIRIGEEYSLD